MEIEKVTYNEKYLTKAKKGNPWIHRGELVGPIDHIEPGSLVDVFTSKDDFVGRGYINPNSAIAVRLLTRRPGEEIGRDFFRRRIEQANELRMRIYPQLNAYRVVYGESDGLPGLVIDRYGDVLVLSFATVGMDRWRDAIVEGISDIFLPRAIVLRNDTRLRLKEALPLEKGVIVGELPENIVIQEHGLSYCVDVMEGRKTGFFFDQRENRGMLARFIEGDTALDCYTYTGAWALTAAINGASEVWGIDNDVGAIQLAERNASLNNIHSCTFIAMDMDQYIEQVDKMGKRFGCIIFDPPAFIKTKRNMAQGLEGYLRRNAEAMKLVKRGGLFVTSSCSSYLSWDGFLSVIQKASLMAERMIRILAHGSQAPDHPILPALKKTAYLKCLFLRVD
ncbi:MAG: class I SAM-dependent rRNA methyltransferase [Syntrophobacterales bacterium]|nr:MAG: class I SAM-dependent rRNA methyltransferase [Syntrophobacterales bacterium]